MSFMNGLSENFLQRLAGGKMDPAQPNDQQDMGQLMGGVPQESFQQHATNALSQVDPQQYQNHIMPGVGNTNPLGGLGKGMLGSIAGSLIGNMLGSQMGGGMGSLAGSLAGSVMGGQAAQGGIGGLANMLGLNHSDPQQMDEQDVAKVAAHAQQNNPGALAATAAQYQNQPDILHAILGNKALLLAGAGLAAGVMSGQLKPKF
jgi:outer membrane lipoprotein SlyB